ncbi:bacteriochlorophyll 4-vinyl reductase [Bacillus hwajinpoensis]|uniref:Bacteriochlorophyll 4-vinyl reductase n=1 Tax=Guptibacillus hwajinpoensis TaxID=208199 RepID=A0A845F3W2_9BACL|nr:bacteriochlorophyll 4-vinyl reductase [Pseudalkalibacillus hwajinpoensis]MYL65489.1 bacteriochlorophyll 4-vinyl reductase [Pseudalkalibacillus hwajinpoensis]
MEKNNQNEKLEIIIEKALLIPGVKVNRDEFLKQTFAKRKNSSVLTEILRRGPYEAGIPINELDNLSKSIIQKRTLTSTSLSFGAGIPGGFALAGTIPADIIQFFSIALKLSQELAYLYGHQDLWLEEHLDTEEARNKLILFLGVMFGVGGSTSLIKVVSSELSKQTLKKLPRKALTKTFYYPIIKKIASYLGVKVTKDSFAKGISKAIPLVGGVVSGTLTYTTMLPMGKRLAKSLSETLVITEDDLENSYNNLKKEFPNIIDIEFEEIGTEK